MSGNNPSQNGIAGLVKKHIVYETERFEYSWENVEVLNYMYHHDRMDKPIQTKAISVNFASDIFNGTWSFRLCKKPGAQLIVTACYTKIDALLKGEFKIKLEMIHDSKTIWTGTERSGETVTTNEILPDFLAMSTRRPVQAKSGKTIVSGVQGKSEEVKVTVRMCRIQWIIAHEVVEKLIGHRYQSPDIIFTFHIEGRFPQK